ncbi:hypothetical protein L6452_20950 [Arctium lappa]|uniref:Uncharacterized protein n=1 Tax=Arctium lappa TaxID=4217 RepID=A0ACB9BD95_ARCLA|nr:hypothetical protein L6452_20950 [Arctium lappa]
MNIKKRPTQRKQQDPISYVGLPNLTPPRPLLFYHYFLFSFSSLSTGAASNFLPDFSSSRRVLILTEEEKNESLWDPTEKYLCVILR